MDGKQEQMVEKFRAHKMAVNAVPMVTIADVERQQILSLVDDLDRQLAIVRGENTRFSDELKTKVRMCAEYHDTIGQQVRRISELELQVRRLDGECILARQEVRDLIALVEEFRQTRTIAEKLASPVHETSGDKQDLFLDIGRLDSDKFEVARAVHRIVRAMHDGECPYCHRLMNSSDMHPPSDPYSLKCPMCYFTISEQHIKAAMVAFAPVMRDNLKVFEKWKELGLP